MADAGSALTNGLLVNEAAKAAEQPQASAQFADLLSECWDRAYRFAYHLTGNSDQAEDLIQEAAAEAFGAFDRFSPGTHFDRWLMRIMHHTYLDRMRHARRHRIFSLEDVAPASLQAAGMGDPEAAIEASLDGPVRRALLALPPEYRAPIILVDLEELAYEDAAEILHIPIGTVRSRLHRGRLALREWLRPYVNAVKRGEL